MPLSTNPRELQDEIYKTIAMTNVEFNRLKQLEIEREQAKIKHSKEIELLQEKHEKRMDEMRRQIAKVKSQITTTRRKKGKKGVHKKNKKLKRKKYTRKR